MATSIEFNHIMQMLNEIRIGSAKSQGIAVLSFAISLSAVFFALAITVEDNLLYEIFGLYFLIMGVIAIVLSRLIVKNIRRNFYDRMSFIEKSKRGRKIEFNQDATEP